MSCGATHPRTLIGLIGLSITLVLTLSSLSYRPRFQSLSSDHGGLSSRPLAHAGLFYTAGHDICYLSMMSATHFSVRRSASCSSRTVVLCLSTTLLYQPHAVPDLVTVRIKCRECHCLYLCVIHRVEPLIAPLHQVFLNMSAWQYFFDKVRLSDSSQQGPEQDILQYT